MPRRDVQWGRYTPAAIAARAPKQTETCTRCGHPADWHRLDDSTNVSPVDPAAKFRCIGYDCAAPGPVPPGGRACDCPDMVRSEVAGVDVPINPAP